MLSESFRSETPRTFKKDNDVVSLRSKKRQSVLSKDDVLSLKAKMITSESPFLKASRSPLGTQSQRSIGSSLVSKFRNVSPRLRRDNDSENLSSLMELSQSILPKKKFKVKLKHPWSKEVGKVSPVIQKKAKGGDFHYIQLQRMRSVTQE